LVFSLALLAGCSEAAVVGAYQKVQDPAQQLVLSDDGTFMMVDSHCNRTTASF
jgi:hypothetical protein